MITKLFIVFSLLIISSGLISDAPYIKQIDRTMIAGHRGLSAIFPGLSLKSFKKIPCKRTKHACMLELISLNLM